jgi:hypothetical protein
VAQKNTKTAIRDYVITRMGTFCAVRSAEVFDLRPVWKHLRIRTPLTFQVLGRSFATHNQTQLKNVQVHLGQESTRTTADIYAVEIPDKIRPTQERLAAEIQALVGESGRAKPQRKPTEKVDATGPALAKPTSVSS